MPKRKHKELEAAGDSQSDIHKQGNTICQEVVSSQDSNSFDEYRDSDGPAMKKPRKSVNFENVDVYYFHRTQGFACVPSQGGTTLGMTEKHIHQEQYTLKHYRKMRKIVRRKKADEEESAENSFSLDAILEISTDEIAGTDSEEDDTEMDGFFLQPVPTRRRRSLLKLAGVKKLDNTEKDECKELRGSREQCGCDCEGICEPSTCLCSINGIQCQVDRYAFPCGCTVQGCGNPAGRIEFNQEKVRKHYIHTLGRLKTQDIDQTTEVSPHYKSSLTSKHVHFTEDGENVASTGETEFNSTAKGTCLDCSNTTNCPPAQEKKQNQSVTTFNPPAPEHSTHKPTDTFYVASSLTSSCHGLDNTANASYVQLQSAALVTDEQFSAEATFSDDEDSVDAPMYRPISGLLNPIMNVRSSHTAGQVINTSHDLNHASWQLPLDEAAIADSWQSHESMLTNADVLQAVSSSSDSTCSTQQNTALVSSSFDSILSSFQSSVNDRDEIDSSPCVPLLTSSYHGGTTADDITTEHTTNTFNKSGSHDMTVYA